MTRAFVLTNHKGGVGKSTSATNIALGMVQVLRHLNAPNTRVLLIDTDSQAHATLVTTGRNDFDINDSLYTVLMSDRESAAKTSAPELHHLNARDKPSVQRRYTRSRYGCCLHPD